MVELFNPAGLSLVEDRQGAIAYGYVAPRVMYARVVGRISAELGARFVVELDLVTRRGGPLAYFADQSALRELNPQARSRFRAFFRAKRERFCSIVLLTWASGRWRGLTTGVKGVELVQEPLEFERSLCNVAPFPDRTAKEWAHVWQLHAPRNEPLTGTERVGAARTGSLDGS